MAEVKMDEPFPSSGEEDEATLAAIDRGIKAAEEDRVVPSDEARKRIQEWLSKSSTQKTR